MTALAKYPGYDLARSAQLLDALRLELAALPEGTSDLAERRAAQLFRHASAMAEGGAIRTSITQARSAFKHLGMEAPKPSPELLRRAQGQFQ